MHCCVPTPTTDNNTRTSMIWVALNMGSSAVNRQGNVTELSVNFTLSRLSIYWLKAPIKFHWVKVKVNVWTLATAPQTSSTLQSWKWQLIGMSQWCRSTLCGHPLPALTDNWTHDAASRHTTAPISHARPVYIYAVDSVVSLFVFTVVLLLFNAAEQDTRNLEELEELVWDCSKAPPDQQIDQFMILARQVNADVHVY